MKSWIGALLVAMICLPQGILAGQRWAGAEWVPGHLIVNFRPEIGTLQDKDGNEDVISVGNPSVDELLTRYRVTSMWRIADDLILAKLKVVPDFYRLVVLQCPPETDLLSMIADFEANPYVEYAEPNLLRPTCARIPNDPLWNSQWDKRLMNLHIAWEFSTGSRDIIVCAIDGGTCWDQEDLYDNLWVNPGEDLDGDGIPYDSYTYPGDFDDFNGQDDDHNGKVDDLIAWDFVRNIPNCANGEDCDSQEDNNPYSVEDHGTHVLGLMGATGNNGIGIAGAAWNVRVMAGRAGYRDRDGEGRVVQAAALSMMTWAVAHGAVILNMSYGDSFYSAAEYNTLQTCWANGVVLCGAAGNDHITTVHYPSSYNNVVSVGSVDQNDAVSDFSNYGPWLDIFAPGNMVMSTVCPGYAEYPGTSMASPNAAGVFAILWSIFPEKTNQDLVDLVFNNCVDITAVNPTYNPSHLGYGRIDARLAIASLLPHLTLEQVTITGDNDADGRIEPGETGNLVFTLRNETGWSVGQGLDINVVTQDPNLMLSNTSSLLPTILPGEAVQTSASPVQITVTAVVPHAYWAEITIQVRGPNNYTLDVPFFLRIGRPQTFFVADDGAFSYHNFFMSSLLPNASGYDYDLWSIPEKGDPTYADISEYDIIVWMSGDEASNTLTAANQSVLSQYLDAGGNLLLSGQNIDEDISSSAFYANYLHCQSSAANGSRDLSGVAGDPISDGLSLILQGGACGGNGLTSPSKIAPVNDGIAFFNYLSGGAGAVRFQNETYKTAYFAFALEAACGIINSAHHSVVIRRVMDWFGATQVDAEPPVTPAVPEGFALRQNYPNPFNPTTEIVFEVPRAMTVSLRVFDMLGRHVATLVNGQVTAGSHQITFDGSDLASGVYLTQLVAGDFTATQRMVLLK